MTTSDAQQSIPAGTIRRGIWLLPIAGIIPTIIFTLWMAGPNPDIATDPKGAADATTSVLGLGGGVVYLLATIALLFGLFALYAWLAGGPTGTAALTGLVLSVMSVGLLLAGVGAFTLASAVAADVYRSGNAGASGVLAKLSGGNFGTAILADLIAGSLLGLVGAILFGVAIWRSGTLPKWAGVLFAAGFVLVVATAPIVSQLGGILVAIGGVWIARTIGRSGTTGTATTATVAPA